MDNITHTLVGAALGQAGLKRRTALAMATLVIGANLPDIDGIAYWTGGAIGFRRGWTHGILAMLVLPLLLTGGILGWDRLMRRRRRRSAPAAGAVLTASATPAGAADVLAAAAETGAGAVTAATPSSSDNGTVAGAATTSAEAAAPLVPRQVLFLAFVAVLTHPFLDFLNTYGVRWLMPFRDVWYHGDAWSIMDPWVWLVLGLGVLLSAWLGRRGRAPRTADYPARLALAVVAAYALTMLTISSAGRRSAAGKLAADGGSASAIMVGPSFGDPLVWDVVARQGDAYRLGTLTVLPWRVRLDPTAVPIGLDDPAARAAAASPREAGFLHWARFPAFRVQRGATATVVRISDMRYGRDGWAAATFTLPPDRSP